MKTPAGHRTGARPTGRRRTRTAGALVLALTALLSGCGSGTSAGTSTGTGGTSAGAGRGPVRVVASTDVWGDVAAAVGGDAVQVTSIITSPDQDPHSFEASAKTQLELSRADVVVQNGGGYDDFVPTMLRSTRSRARVLDAVRISGHRPDAAGELNEHVWYDLPAVAAVADALASALARARPQDAAAFSAGADAFKGRLGALEATEAGTRAAAGGTGVAVTEPVPLYLLQACGLVDRTPAEFSRGVEEGTDVPPAVLQRTEDLFSSHAVRALVYNAQTTGPQTEAVLAAARRAGVAVVPVTETLPPGQDYLSWMADNLARVRTAVTPGS